MRTQARFLSMAFVLGILGASAPANAQFVWDVPSTLVPAPMNGTLLQDKAVSHLLQRLQDSRRLRVSFQTDSIVGQWAGWTGTASIPASIRRCQVTISKGMGGELVGTMIEKGLGMAVERQQAHIALAQYSPGPAGRSLLTIKLTMGAQVESVIFTQTRQGQITYLTATSRSGVTCQLWRSDTGYGVFPATER